MQHSPYFNNGLSPEETSKFFPSFQHFNNGLCSPRTLFYGIGLNSSGQNSYTKKYILSKMKFSSSGTKNFLSNKRNYNSESIEKNKQKKLSHNNQRIKTNSNTNDNNQTTTVFINETKASSKINSTYPIPNTSLTGINIDNYNENKNYLNYNYHQYNNYYNQGKSNSSFVKFNKSAYIGSVKKNLLPSLSNELRSNSKNKINKKNNNIINTSSNSSSNNKNKKQSCSKSTFSLNNTSNKKTTNESTAYDNLCKTAESLDLEKMIDYIVSSTKIYNRYNDNKENYSNNNFNNLLNKNEIIDDINYINSTEKKNEKKNKKILCNDKNNNISINLNNNETQKNSCSLCKCKKVECLKYSCSCLKSGNKCNNLCGCTNCKNKENYIFKINY